MMSLGAWAGAALLSRWRRRRHRVERVPGLPVTSYTCSCGMVFAHSSSDDNRTLATDHAKAWGGELVEGDK